MFPAPPPEPPARRDPTAGFTLIEVLVALAVAAAVLSAIGLLVGGNARATRALEQRAALRAVAQAVEAGIPPREALREGRLNGSIAGHDWQMDVRPLDVGELPEGIRFVPHLVHIRVRGPRGGAIEVETVRLVPTAPPEGADPGAPAPGTSGGEGQ